MALVGYPYAVPEVFPSDPLGGPLQYPAHGTNAPMSPYVDVSLLSPDQQFSYLVNMMLEDDSDQPAPFTGTPPRPDLGEGIHPDDVIPEQIIDQINLGPPPDVEAQANQDLQRRVRDAYEPYIYNTWRELDDQHYGLGVPPGPPNLDQPIESGHTQILRQDPSAGHGSDVWSGRPALARVARMFNAFPSYNAGTSRGHGVVPIKTEVPYVWLTQQYRDLLLSELKRRGIHSIVIADVPSVPYTEQVIVIDPTTLQPEPYISAEGVLPW
jgi:hypothetical protein